VSSTLTSSAGASAPTPADAAAEALAMFMKNTKKAARRQENSIEAGMFVKAGMY
jgi:hypothetical protein